METILKKRFSKATETRLLQILLYLENYPEKKITSVKLGKVLGVKDSLIRYDISSSGFSKGISNGYESMELINHLRLVLGFVNENSDEKKCCIVGLGRLGAALLDETLFDGSGVRICAGFDSSVNRTEILRSTFPLFPATQIERIVSGEKIDFAILCVPEKETVVMVERLVKGGIKGIVNFTKTVIQVPNNVKVENISPVMALLQLQHKILIRHNGDLYEKSVQL